MKLHTFLKSTAIFLLLLMGSPLSYAQEGGEVTPVGKVVWVNGDFRAMQPDKEIRKLSKASVIFLHDTLTTDANTQAQIVFSDNTMMTFKPETKFYIERYEFNKNAKTKSVGKYMMNLLEGGFRTITGLIAKKNPDDYQVNTPVATIGVRGTDYAVYFHKGELFIGYYEGKPCVRGGVKKEELCLDKEKPYGYVDSKSIAPVPLTQQPAVFQEKMTIISTAAPVFSNIPPSAGGVINNSFCITN